MAFRPLAPGLDSANSDGVHARSSLGLVLLLALAGCMTIHGRYRICDPASGLESPAFRVRLSETGLYADASTQTLAEGVTPFTPNFELWSDGASKQRWLYLPPGSAIDARDPDDWLFPTGTRFWKEFKRDGRRIETRLLQKIGPAPDAWLAVSYVWNGAGTDARAAPAGVVDAHGTPHDVPAAESELVRRMVRDSRFKARMAPLATETIDADGVALVTRWIDERAKAPSDLP